MTGRTSEKNGSRVFVEYSDGSEITVDYNERWIEYGGRRIYISGGEDGKQYEQQ